MVWLTCPFSRVVFGPGGLKFEPFFLCMLISQLCHSRHKFAMTVNPVLKRILIGTGLVLTLLFFLKEPLRRLPYQYAHRQVNKTVTHQIEDGIKTPENMLSEVRQWQEKTKVKKIVGLVFYGRRQQASILDCYLKVSVHATIWPENTLPYRYRPSENIQAIY